MSFFDSIILGIVQGITEFLPISSSGHLILVRELLNISESVEILTFDILIHVATALAIIVYFWKDLIYLLKGVLEKNDVSYRKKSWRLVTAIIIGSIPAALIGILFEDNIQSIFRSTSSVIWILLLGTVLIAGAEFYTSRRKGDYSKNISIPKGFMIGIFQALALMPGMSRSGSTISGGLFLGLSRSEAARFSFLLGLPVMIGAGLVKVLKNGIVIPDVSLVVIFSGAITAFIVGLISVTLLMKILRNNSLWMFVWYRLVLVVLLFVFL